MFAMKKVYLARYWQRALCRSCLTDHHNRRPGPLRQNQFAFNRFLLTGVQHKAANRCIWTSRSVIHNFKSHESKGNVFPSFVDAVSQLNLSRNRSSRSQFTRCLCSATFSSEQPNDFRFWSSNQKPSLENRPLSRQQKVATRGVTTSFSEI